MIGNGRSLGHNSLMVAGAKLLQFLRRNFLNGNRALPGFTKQTEHRRILFAALNPYAIDFLA
jgi:hypothetical protein